LGADVNWLNVAMVVLALAIVAGGLAMVFAGARAMGEDRSKER
jgi:succinate-acetate transporter protein